MIDFALTDKGDLILDEQPMLVKFRLDFRLAQLPGFKLKFFQAPYQDVVKNNHFKITFDVKAHSDVAKYRAALAEDIEEAVQQVKIRLRTELTELPQRQTVGSQLRLMKHERLNNTLNLSRIRQMTIDAVSSIVANVEVVAKAEAGIGHFYCQNVNIYIYSDGILFYKFSL